MPELPEVETMVRGLRTGLVGQTIRAIEVIDPHLLHGVGAEEIERRVRGATVSGVDRRGKWVVLTLGGRRGLIVIQPRMTGGFWLVEPPRPAHVRLVFRLRGGDRSVWFCDTRRLGKLHLFDSPAQADQAIRRSLGTDALIIGLEELRDQVRKTRRPIKPTLMDQKVLAGIGNIYADEILHRARIHPSRLAAELSDEEITRIHASICPILETAIAAEGSSFDAGYRTVLGLEGGFLAQNAVHRRASQPCSSCKQPIIKTNIPGLIGRPTYYCPTCQPEHP